MRSYREEMTLLACTEDQMAALCSEVPQAFDKAVFLAIPSLPKSKQEEKAFLLTFTMRRLLDCRYKHLLMKPKAWTQPRYGLV